MLNKNLESIINKIRDILRREGITGMQSINHCLALITCRFLNKELCDKLKIPHKFTFEEISKIESKSKLHEVFCKTNISYYKFFVTTLGFNGMKWKLKSELNLQKIIKLLKKLDINDLSNEYDLVGTIYELHLRSGTTGKGMRDLGQYFTHRLVIKYMVELCKPKIINGNIETICDPTMGTGGFLTMCIKHLNNNYNIDWDKNKS